MIIKNKKEIAITRQREQVLEIIETGIRSVLPAKLIWSAVKYSPQVNSITVAKKDYDLIKGRIFVIGGGKASGLMAEELEKLIGPRHITAGVVNAIKGKYKTEKIKIIKAGHPLPDKKGIEGVKQMLELKQEYNIGEKDLVICLISGGGSALMPYPPAGISLKDKQATTDLLIKSGAPIRDINAVRKHISRVKGGRLAKHFAPTQVVSLIISDVVSNDLNVIASGPTVLDPTAFSDAYYILGQYELLNKVPKSVLEYIERGRRHKEKETMKESRNCDNYIIGKNAMALEGMAYKAKHLGFKPIILSFEQTGEPRVVVKKITKDIKLGKYLNYDMLLIGGETNPRVPDNIAAHAFQESKLAFFVRLLKVLDSWKPKSPKPKSAKKYLTKRLAFIREGETPVIKGGRNQHFVATSMLAMKDYVSRQVVASVCTDGVDYIPEVAGALVDSHTIKAVEEKNINVQKYLDNYNTYTLFQQIGNSHIITGNTGTNVGDVMVWVLK